MGVLLVLARARSLRGAASIALALAAMGLIVELLQGLIPGRTPLWEDAADNAIGALSGSLGGWVGQACGRETMARISKD